MLSDGLSSREIEQVRECLRAAVEGPFFPDWEFHTLMGVERAEVDAVWKAWPDVTTDPISFRCAVLGSLNNLSGYPHRKEAVLREYLSFDASHIPQLMARLKEVGI